MDKEKIIQKLKKIKALAEGGIDGEKDGALKLYNELLLKYEIDEQSIIEEKLEKRWLRYDNAIDMKLIVQIFYKVTGDSKYWVKTDKRRRLVGVECTDFELNEILFYYRFYKEHLDEQIDNFMHAFFIANNLFPDSTARVQETNDKEINNSAERLEKLEKIMALTHGIDTKTPLNQIDMKDET